MIEPVSPAAIHAPPERLRLVAEALEASFLAEMLRHSGIEEGASAGADQMMSFRTRMQAEAMVEAGGIGLAESILDGLMARSHDR
ncbi:hypothetical protein BCF33_2089 [Hasllibacter halocynthiae]|uniref:Rod binding protein n=1 Tax=Hasllibacter halocynthiae TaxID=595589 RepID=A0A2T0X2P1_9RHOB|nr:flagellar biosynthesis protein FlgJ [Hasllibacter halocynthiae]PRY93222.1 hypothetical protein BCF33_2089 [Hasllibacter halocynthiae]